MPFFRPQRSVPSTESFLERIQEDAGRWRVRYPIYRDSRMCVISDPIDNTRNIAVLRDWRLLCRKPDFIPTTVFIYERERECNGFCFKLQIPIQNLSGSHFSAIRLRKRFNYIKPQVDTIRVVGGWKLVMYRFPEYCSHGTVFEWHKLNSRLLKAWKILKENATQQRKMFRLLTVPTRLWRPITTPLPLNW